jgi:hypothetical protein
MERYEPFKFEEEDFSSIQKKVFSMVSKKIQKYTNLEIVNNRIVTNNSKFFINKELVNFIEKKVMIDIATGENRLYKDNIPNYFYKLAKEIETDLIQKLHFLKEDIMITSDVDNKFVSIFVEVSIYKNADGKSIQASEGISLLN